MATCIARRFYSLCSSTCINMTPPLGNRSYLQFRLTNSVSSRVCYGTQGSNSSQDTQVHIPVERLTVSYSRSSGPGGQHVNKEKNRLLLHLQLIGFKVSTKAEVRFHINTADWIPEDVRQKIVEKNKNRINKAGELLVTSEVSRSQQRNLSDCLQKISAIIDEANVRPHEPSAEDIALRAARIEKRNNQRLKQKKIFSAIKNSRRMDFD